MNPAGITTLVLAFMLLSNSKTYGFGGTKSNQFPFVVLGSNGVTPSLVYSLETLHFLNPPINLGGTTFQSLHISSTGRIYSSDPSQSSSGPHSPFSRYSSPNYIIAPYWDNLYTGSSGYVKYEMHSSINSSSSSQLLRSSVSTYISEVLDEQASDVDTLLVMEWNGMVSSSSDKYGSDVKTNTFQALVTSSQSGQSYAIFTYKCGELQWGGTPTIGFKASSLLYRNHPFSLNQSSPNPIACVNYPASVWSNVVYKIDGSASSCDNYREFGCSSGLCKPVGYKCDGTSDCPDGIDEVACSPVACFEGKFACWSGGCVSSTKVCDGTWDCPLGSDESNCHSTDASTGPILGIVCAGLIAIVTIIFCIITISSISCQVKQYNRHRAQFQQLCSLVSIQPQTTPTTHMLRSHRPRFGEWYQTSEGHWFQGPPPAYSPGDEQTSSLSNEGRGSLNGGLGDTAASSAPVQVEVELETISTPSASSDSGSVLIIPSDSDASGEVSSEASIVNEVGVANEDGNRLESSIFDSSIVESEGIPLIETREQCRN